MRQRGCGSAGVCSLVGLVVGLAGCAGPAEPADGQLLGYDEFKARAYQEPETGFYVTNGDELAETEAELEAAYDRYVESSLGLDTAEQSLAINLVNGQDDKWSAAAAANLTFCVDTAGFGNTANAVLTALNNATAAWEATANVNFVYLSAQDRSCTVRNNNVVFDVRSVRGQPYLARSFFPSSARAARELLIDKSAFRNIAPYTLTGVLTHELGHVLGFRHEHTRPEAHACFEDNAWRALTAYDALSVMHYPQCGGANTGDLRLTDLDRTGARGVYP